jgi:membrane-bound lytic murein transglycosylase B
MGVRLPARWAFVPVLLAGIRVVDACLTPAVAQPYDTGFQRFLDGLWPEVRAAGIPRPVFDAAFAGVTIDERVVARVGRQPEYGKPIKAYIDDIASPARIEIGRRKSVQWLPALAAVERMFGVNRAILLGIWGIESSYGDEKPAWDVIRSLATLAQTGDRTPYFRGELIAALQMLRQNAVERGHMLGSWEGAMGQPQFMPSTYLKYAIDFTGDGRRDIWNSVPDALASMANYLREHGWNPDLPWGFEVTVPPGFDYRRSRATFAEWKKLGLKPADGQDMPVSGAAILYFPTGASGPAFLVTGNFIVIKTYNNSDVYALAVAQLGDRIRGAGPVRAPWPANDVQLTRNQRITLQKKLAGLGYKVDDFEAHIDFDLRDSIRDVQLKLGMVPDGSPTPQLLRRLDELRP